MYKLHDSVSALSVADDGLVVVTGSHGGLNAARHAARFSIKAICFNDAGVGKHDAGVSGLDYLAKKDIPAVCVSHVSACIGDASDTYRNGVISWVNAPALRRGVESGDTVKDFIKKIEG